MRQDVTGAKAAALATARRSGLPTVPGFVISTAAVERIAAGAPLGDDVLTAWRELSENGRRVLVVRSSSTVEDLGDSSMAGRFESVVGVSGAEEFRRAVDVVVASRHEAAAGSDTLTGREPLAVLVQPLLDARSGGVLFGIDPVSGREDRLVVAAVEGGPDRLVSGEVDGDRYELDRAGRRTEVTRGDGGVRLRKPQLRSLAQLAERTATVFGGPQDVEWAFDSSGRLRLLQSRPVTAEPRGRPVGPVLGPGPVAETFPEPLQPLETDLWVVPLREALRQALLLAGTADGTAVDASPLVTVLGGRAAVDLDLLEPRQQAPACVTDSIPGPGSGGCGPPGGSDGCAPRSPRWRRTCSSPPTTCSPACRSCPSSPTGSSWRSCTAPGRPSSRCTRTRSSWACSWTPRRPGSPA
ncbi:PEP/pyruvate-binding domain-containing protein [Blastococcus brunescens]|uniref:PEP/pyruvate-binding domain-containing protein n=1 Tax=Blastococcus brunescens TaxID=1564165 RepID=A0ABZ1B6E5_9ACTN|nr:PEP/pyruvate-binding domain-containing protein [Blastococcus sp. BMG 8361]WRL66369.1 PEP/pyruvate-binding domain-containing protein [Blastococcus sp. BMG 8361]